MDSNIINEVRETKKKITECTVRCRRQKKKKGQGHKIFRCTLYFGTKDPFPQATAFRRPWLGSKVEALVEAQEDPPIWH